MRIVGGTFKSRVLFEFKGNDIRPTADKVRESLFNILQNRIYGSTFLDLFCGTGAMGLEAISRGAKSVTFNDISRDSVALTKKNVALLKIDGGYKITNFDGVSFLKNTTEKYDIIFIDPPYKSEVGLKALAIAKNALNDGGVVIYENEKPFDGQADGLIQYDERKYGRVYLTFFKGE